MELKIIENNYSFYMCIAGNHMIGVKFFGEKNCMATVNCSR